MSKKHRGRIQAQGEGMEKSMVLYANFLTNKRVYNLAQAYWKRLFDRLAKACGFAWSPYINQMQGGKKEYDGNPIFSAYVVSKNRAVRIIQAAPEEGSMEISVWVDSIELKDGKSPVPELVMDVVLSPATKDLAEKLVEGWLAEGWTEKEIQKMLAFEQET